MHSRWVLPIIYACVRVVSPFNLLNRHGREQSQSTTKFDQIVEIYKTRDSTSLGIKLQQENVFGTPTVDACMCPTLVMCSVAFCW